MASVTPLGEFLRSRRRTARPPADHASPGNRRRVPGLRREEVAARAGVSVDYYVRLEQGREVNPSARVVAGLSEALGLDGEEAAYLWLLTSPKATPGGSHPSASGVRGLTELVEHQLTDPAILLDASGTVRAGNGGARLLYGADVVGKNVVLDVFLSDESRFFYLDWEEAARCSVGVLRTASVLFPEQREVRDTVADLTARSPEFRDIWNQYPVLRKSSGRKLLHHRELGRLDLAYEALESSAAPGLQAVVYRPWTPPAAPSSEGTLL
ncbi:helix-turn-helix transcriptional regulator [Streptomyces sp. enrichment culture]|uniref:helix-turn-helix transcriptional regulator n=1 Tax=Streptomyces sp. enrichment culture TaxID=1795815 RepID=UPI003F576E85